MAKKIARVALLLAMLASAWLAIALQPHHQRCRLVPTNAPTPQQNHLEHVAKNSVAEGYRLVSPSRNCGRCHDPKAHTLIP
jgi:predicted Zn-ribbon and HTH transcriptional regulator